MSPYAVVHLFPDPNLESTKMTPVIRNNQSPNFNESFDL